MKMSTAKWRPFCLGTNVLKFKSLKYVWKVYIQSEDTIANEWTAQDWGLLSQFPAFRYFLKFSALSKHTLAIEYLVYI